MKTIAATIREKVGKAPRGAFFRTTEFAGSRAAVESHLSRLTGQDRTLLRVRRGLYWKGVPSRFGPGRPRVDDIVRVVAGDRGVGPAGWSASHALGLSTQVPATAVYAIVGPAPAGIPGAEFHSRNNFRRLGLRYEEIALLEVLREWPGTVEADWPTLVARVARLRATGLLRPVRMRKAVEGEGKPALRERFARLVEGLAGFHSEPAAGGS